MQRSASLPGYNPPALPGSGREPLSSHLGQQLDRPGHRPAFLWRAFWAPFWIWSDSPEPALAERGSWSRAAPRLGLAGEAVVTGIDRVRRRLWVTLAAAAICRGIWLALAFAAVLMLLDVLGGPIVRSTTRRYRRCHAAARRSGSGRVEQAVPPGSRHECSTALSGSRND